MIWRYLQYLLLRICLLRRTHVRWILQEENLLEFNVWKVLFQAALTGINVACWLIPLRSKKVVDNPLALSLANAFSGGVFLALAFGHLIPECLHLIYFLSVATRQK